jgi:YHS domain-containing protein
VRGLLLLTVLVLTVAVLWSLRGAWRPRPASPTPVHDRLVRDPVCRTYVVSARAVRRELGGALRYFCSRECADRYAQGEGRGGPGSIPDDPHGEERG